jgi:hypothetical protein
MLELVERWDTSWKKYFLVIIFLEHIVLCSSWIHMHGGWES